MEPVLSSSQSNSGGDGGGEAHGVTHHITHLVPHIAPPTGGSAPPDLKTVVPVLPKCYEWL